MNIKIISFALAIMVLKGCGTSHDGSSKKKEIKYGESIYKTRPWYTYGEGPVKEPEGGFRSNRAFLKIKYSAEDVRYTTKDDIIYAT